jgi:hypothetical protein
VANGLHLVQIRSNRRRARHWSQRARLAFADSLDGWCEVGLSFTKYGSVRANLGWCHQIRVLCLTRPSKIEAKRSGTREPQHP